MGRTVYLPIHGWVTFYGKLVGKYTVRHMDHNGFGHVLGVSGSSEYGDRWLEAGSSLQPSDIRRHSFGEAACKADIEVPQMWHIN